MRWWCIGVGPIFFAVLIAPPPGLLSTAGACAGWGRLFLLPRRVSQGAPRGVRGLGGHGGGGETRRGAKKLADPSRDGDLASTPALILTPTLGSTPHPHPLNRREASSRANATGLGDDTPLFSPLFPSFSRPTAEQKIQKRAADSGLEPLTYRCLLICIYITAERAANCANQPLGWVEGSSTYIPIFQHF